MRIFILTLAALSVTSLAYDIVIINDSPNPVIPFVQSLGTSGEAPDSMGGYILSGKERVYDNANVWLNSAAMAVEEGETRTVSIFDGLTTELKLCGSVMFEAGTVLTYKSGECVKTSAASVTNTDRFKLFAPYVSYGWIVENFDTGDVSRTYATGPTKLNWTGAIGTTTIVYQAVEHTTKQIVDINLKAYKSDPCSSSNLINDAAGCQVQRKTYLHAVYEPAMNPDLPTGSYSGIANLFGSQWHGGEEINTYLNIEY